MLAASLRRVAVPSVHFVPWAALVSCWPRPQQLLSVSAAGGGRRCCTFFSFLRLAASQLVLRFRRAWSSAATWNHRRSR